MTKGSDTPNSHEAGALLSECLENLWDDSHLDLRDRIRAFLTTSTFLPASERGDSTVLGPLQSHIERQSDGTTRLVAESIPAVQPHDKRGDVPLNCDRDPQRWAEEFNRVLYVQGREPLDEGWLIGWFANAMMCGEDTYRWRQEAKAQSAIGPASEDAACKVAATLLRNEIVRLEYPKSMFPQEAEKIGRRQTAFQAAIRFLDPPEDARSDRGSSQ